LIVLITNIRNVMSTTRSCSGDASIVGLVCFTDASLRRHLIGQIKLTRIHVPQLCLARGARSNGTTGHLYTMSKDPVAAPKGTTQPNFALCLRDVSLVFRVR